MSPEIHEYIYVFILCLFTVVCICLLGLYSIDGIKKALNFEYLISTIKAQINI